MQGERDRGGEGKKGRERRGQGGEGEKGIERREGRGGEGERGRVERCREQRIRIRIDYVVKQAHNDVFTSQSNELTRGPPELVQHFRL
jgi:hypothetical protein